jgi:hypothetical protein
VFIESTSTLKRDKTPLITTPKAINNKTDGIPDFLE